MNTIVTSGTGVLLVAVACRSGASQRRRVRHPAGSARDRHHHGLLVQKPARLLFLQVKNPMDGRGDEVEGGAASVVHPRASRDSVAVGDVVTIVGDGEGRRPDGLMLGKDLYKRDGTFLSVEYRLAQCLRRKNRNRHHHCRDLVLSARRVHGVPRRGEQVARYDKVHRRHGDCRPTSTTQKDCIPVGVPGADVLSRRQYHHGPT